MTDTTTVVAPDVATLRRIAQSYGDRAAELSHVIVALNIMKITPGSFDMANQITTIFETGRTNLVKFFTDLKWAMAELGRQLITIADKYKNAEDLNQDDAGKVAELIAAFQEKYPDIASTVPQAPTTTFTFPTGT